MATISRARAEALRIETNKRRMRKVAIVGACFPLLVAFWGSYWHIVETVGQHEHNWITVHIYPLAPDGLMLVCAVAIVAQSRPGFTVAKGGFWLGLGISFMANILASDGTMIGYLFGAAPALMLMASAESLLRMFVPGKPKRKRKPAAKPAQRADKVPTQRRHSASQARPLQSVAGR